MEIGCLLWGIYIIYILPHFIITYFFIFVKYKDKDDDHGMLYMELGEPIAPHTRHPITSLSYPIASL